MKRVLNDLTPLPGNDLFITQYWFDKQTDPPLHFHEDYMLSLTLNVKTKEVKWDLSGRRDGSVVLEYMLLVGMQPVSALRVSLFLRK